MKDTLRQKVATRVSFVGEEIYYTGGVSPPSNERLKER
jgi:hypothetical protein